MPPAAVLGPWHPQRLHEEPPPGLRLAVEPQRRRLHAPREAPPARRGTHPSNPRALVLALEIRAVEFHRQAHAHGLDQRLLKTPVPPEHVLLGLVVPGRVLHGGPLVGRENVGEDLEHLVDGGLPPVSPSPARLVGCGDVHAAHGHGLRCEHHEVALVRHVEVEVRGERGVRQGRREERLAPLRSTDLDGRVRGGGDPRARGALQQPAHQRALLVRHVNELEALLALVTRQEREEEPELGALVVARRTPPLRVHGPSEARRMVRRGAGRRAGIALVRHRAPLDSSPAGSPARGRMRAGVCDREGRPRRPRVQKRSLEHQA